MIETRLTARDQQLTYERDLPKTPTPADVAAFRQKLGDPSRKMMSAGQEAWLKDGMTASVKAGRPWQVLGNEVVMARLFAPPVRKIMGEAAFKNALAGLPEGTEGRLARLEGAAALGLPYGLDMWDGYPADRQRLYGLIKDAKANCIVVSGDSHAFWANELYDAEAGGKRVAVEFGATGITSPGAGDVLKTIPVGELFAKHNREVVFCDQAAKGFVLLTLTHADAKAELVTVSTIHQKPYATGVLKSFRMTPGADGVSGVTALSAARGPGARRSPGKRRL
jgi:alkaline phosphatase D